MYYRSLLLSISLLIFLLSTGCDSGALVDPGDSSIGDIQPKQAVQSESAQMSNWASLSTEELTKNVAKADGRVFIGFKELDAETGVSDVGENLVSPQTFEAGKALALEEGELRFEFDDLPII